MEQNSLVSTPSRSPGHGPRSAKQRQLSKMISLGPFILIAGISIVILLYWVWLPFAAIAKLCGLGAHRKKNTGLLPVRAAAGEVRYRAEGFFPPPQVLQNDPHAFDPEVRHHNYLKVDPRRAEQRFQNREARDAYEDTFGLDRRRSGGHRIRSRERRGERSARARQAKILRVVFRSRQLR